MIRMKGNRWIFLGAALAVALIGGLPGAASAQTVAEVAAYQGPDRLEKLIEGARKEGGVTIYTSSTVEDMDALMSAFEKKYGIRVKVWRGSSENLVQRAVVEARGNRHEADIYETNGVEMEALHREKLMQAIDLPVFKELLPQAITSHKDWIGTRLNVFTVGYNTDRVRKEDAPKTYDDLLDPKWKGKLGVEIEDADWLATLAREMGEEKALTLFRTMVKTNGASMRKGHTLLASLVASGEVPLAVTLYNYKIDQLKHDGAPVEWLLLKPVVARVNGAGIARNAPHPYTAVLLFDFMLSDGQKVLAERNFWPTNRAANQRVGLPEPVFVDPAQMLDENAKWTKLFREIFINQSR